jgi:MFS transporter, DHA3 family, macrolide efflux protein
MSHFRRRLQLFSNQSFRNLTASCLCANLGYGLSYVVMAWLVLQPTGAVSSVAILMICFWAPLVFLGPLAGVLCDRYSRKTIIVAGNAIRVIAIAGFVLLMDRYFSNFSLYILAAIIGIGTCFAGPPTWALVRDVVPEKDLLNANVIVDIAYEMGNVIGMGCGGLLLAVLSTKGILSLNAVWFFLAASAIYGMSHTPTPVEKHTNFFEDFHEGVLYLFGNRNLCILYTVQLLLMVGFMTAPILLAPFAKNVMQATVTQFGWLEAALSVGIVLGGVVNPFLADVFGVYRTIFCQVVLLSISFFAFSYVTDFWIGFGLYFVIGFCESTWPLMMTKAQEITDINYQGRVFSTFLSLSGLAVLAIYFLAYFAGDAISLQKMYWIEAAIAGLGAILLIGYCLGLKKTLRQG